MKKILGLTVALIAVIAMLGTGTWAYFNDVATTTNNTITAGKLILSGAGVVTTPIAITKAKPDNTNHNLFGGTITNSGNIDADLYFKVTNFSEEENTWTVGGPEDKAGDFVAGAPHTSDGVGELGELLKLAVWVDADASATWTAGDYYYNATLVHVAHTGSESHATYSGVAPDAAYITADTLLTALAGASEITLKEDMVESANIGLYATYYFPKTAGDHFTINSDNVAQDDGMEFDLAFALVQANE